MIYYFQIQQNKLLDKPLWGLKEDGLSASLNRASVNVFKFICVWIMFKAGYPKNMFTFHALRAGFISIALLIATKDVMEKVHLFSN